MAIQSTLDREYLLGHARGDLAYQQSSLSGFFCEPLAVDVNVGRVCCDPPRAVIDFIMR